MNEINITVDLNGLMPKYNNPTDSCADLYANTILTDDTDSIAIQPWSRKLIKTGISIEFPLGYEGQVRPRSGLALKNGIYVHFGTIDQDYRGDVGVLIFNLSDEPFYVYHHDRIAQLAIVPINQFNFKVVSSLNDTNRGSNGFGSSGV